MALNIKDGETDRLARELAAATGESITTALRTAVEERLRRVRGRARIDFAAEAGRGIIARGHARATGEDRSPETILGYDHDGLPR